MADFGALAEAIKKHFVLTPEARKAAAETVDQFRTGVARIAKEWEHVRVEMRPVIEELKKKLAHYRCILQ